MTTLTLVVYGDPAPQGSKTPGVTKDGRPYMRESSSNKVRAWRKAVVSVARATHSDAHGNPRPELDGPLSARIVFTMPMSGAAVKERRRRPASAPDLSKLLRAVEDALVDAHVIADDARIVEFERLAKVYPLLDPEALASPGATITITPLVADQLALIRPGAPR